MESEETESVCGRSGRCDRSGGWVAMAVRSGAVLVVLKLLGVRVLCMWVVVSSGGMLLEYSEPRR